MDSTAFPPKTRVYCAICGDELGRLPGPYEHDHKPDRSGLDDGPWAPRKKPAPKSPEEMADIRARAWATRRAKYGERGHCGYYRR
jgi:hypothetical protein